MSIDPAEVPARRIRLVAELVGAEPPILRTLELDALLTLDRVHEVLQIAFGWRDRHGHVFVDHDPDAADPDELRWVAAVEDADPTALIETDWTLAQALASASGTLHYLYDESDRWVHLLRFAGERDALEGEPPARVVDGERRGPLENAGGVAAYAALLTLAASGGDPAAGAARAWIEESVGAWERFRPGRFDPEPVNLELARLDPDLAFRGVLDRFTAQLHPALGRELRLYAAPLETADPAWRPSAAERERLVAPVLWVLDRIAEEGLALTGTGRLTPAAVREIVEGLGWQDRVSGAASREKTTPAVRSLRRTMRRLGLVRSLHGRLVRTASGTRAAASPTALWAHLLTAVPRVVAEPAIVRDAAVLALLEIALGADDEPESAARIAFGLTSLGWRVREGEPPTADDARELAEDVAAVFDLLGPSAARRAFARALLVELG